MRSSRQLLEPGIEKQGSLISQQQMYVDGTSVDVGGAHYDRSPRSRENPRRISVFSQGALLIGDVMGRAHRFVFVVLAMT